MGKKVLEKFFDNIGDIMAENGKVTTLLPARSPYKINRVMRP